MSSDFDLNGIVQAVTDSATELSNAQFGAFFYNVEDAGGERYVLYTLSGVSRDAFSRFPLPRNTAVFDPTFRGEGVVRADDITKDPRYGHNAPHRGMPAGHLPVVSYLAVPVVSRSGEVHGGLFLGHGEAGIFTAESEEIVVALAAQAAVAIDNARLMQASQRLAAIVHSSDDAIIGKDLNGIITSWNNGAQRMYGYAPEEIIGKSVTVLMPPEREDEELGILERIRNGQHVDHYETVRRRKDGSLLNISLTVSPIRDQRGAIVGASKIARDITERIRMEQQRELLMAELSHRVKNTMATVLAISRLSFPREKESDPVRAFQARILALAATHNRLAESSWEGVSLRGVIEDDLAPYLDSARGNISIAGPDVQLASRCALSLGMALHELGTNAAKYGALSAPTGNLAIEWHLDGSNLVLRWTESGGPAVTPPSRAGFGRLLIEQSLQAELGSKVELAFRPEGLQCIISLPPQAFDLRSA